MTSASLACVRFIASLLASMTIVSHASAQDRALDALLARPVSAGTIALLVEHPLSPRIVSRLNDALADQRADVRAAAARVIYVTGARQLTSAVVDTLRGEIDIDAAAELGRVVARFTTNDEFIIDAWKRLGVFGAARVLYALAGVRGQAALRAFEQVRTEDNARRLLPTLVRLATRGDAAALATLANAAATRGDHLLFRAAVSALNDRFHFDPGLAEELMDIGLRAESQAVRMEAAWRVLEMWLPGRSLSRPLRTSLVRFVEGGNTGSDLSADLALGLIARMNGHQPQDAVAWARALSNPPLATLSMLRFLSVRVLLTDMELETLGRAVFGDARALRRPTAVERRAAEERRTVRAVSADPTVRVVSGYPKGFAADLMSATECELSRVRGPGDATLTLRPDGSVSHVSLVETPLTAACVRALRTLMITYVVDVDRVTMGQYERALTPFDLDFFACQDDHRASPTRVDNAGGRIEQPRKTVHVNPTYPPSAIEERVQGTVTIEGVISPRGCVARADVIRSVDSRLDWAALQGVLGWRFTPTLLDGTPVPVIATVSVVFALK